MSTVAVSHNTCKARDLYFHVVLDSTASVHLDAVTQWVTTVVGKLYPPPDGCHPCAVVSGTLHNDWLDDEDDDTVKNAILLVCHRIWGPHDNDIIANSRMDGLVVDKESFNPIDDQDLLDPAKVAGVLEQPDDQAEWPAPLGVKAVGVSGVSGDYASKVWGHIVCTGDRDWMDGAGKGYMVHPMFMWDTKSGYWSVREMSCNFGWDTKDWH